MMRGCFRGVRLVICGFVSPPLVGLVVVVLCEFDGLVLMLVIGFPHSFICANDAITCEYAIVDV